MNGGIQTSDVDHIIKTRRTVKPDKMNGSIIEDETINELLSLANWAPTHAKTEPWRFKVISNSKVKEFTQRHADLYKENTDVAGYTKLKYDKIKMLGDNVSHIIIAWMKRVANHKIPEIEEIAATAAAVQNLLLAATAKGIVSFWSTSGLTHHPAMHKELNLGEEDKVLGIIYLGYSDEPVKEGSRVIPLSDKIEWVK
jgi:nitroreductase